MPEHSAHIRLPNFIDQSCLHRICSDGILSGCTRVAIIVVCSLTAFVHEELSALPCCFLVLIFIDLVPLIKTILHGNLGNSQWSHRNQSICEWITRSMNVLCTLLVTQLGSLQIGILLQRSRQFLHFGLSPFMCFTFDGNSYSSNTFPDAQVFQ